VGEHEIEGGKEKEKLIPSLIARKYVNASSLELSYLKALMGTPN